MESLRGRKMYGVFYPGPREEYFACLKLDEDHPDDLGFDKTSIPAGLYGRKKIKNWNERIEQFAQIFSDFEQELDRSGYKIDATRPYIEFYRSLDEMIAMIPVLPIDN